MEETGNIESGSLAERIALAVHRLRGMSGEAGIAEPYGEYFAAAAHMAVFALDCAAGFEEKTADEKRKLNRELYGELIGDKYRESFLNPALCGERFGAELGRLMCFLYYELRGVIPFSFELFSDKSSQDTLLDRRYNVRYTFCMEDIAMLLEVLLEVYGYFDQVLSDGDEPREDAVRDILYYFVSDYADVTIRERVRRQLDPELDHALRIIMDSDLTAEEYLYSFGEYISPCEVRTAAYLATLEDDMIERIAGTFTGGYIRGFANTGKDISKKSVVNIRYRVGFERVVRAAVKQFEKAGLKSVIYRSPVHVLDGRSRGGYYGSVPSRQCDHDHSEDLSLFLDKALVDRRLYLLKEAYEEFARLARVHGGPAVLESFGEPPFSPQTVEERCRYDEKQRELSVKYASKAGEIVNTYIPGEERSYTIMSLPTAEIGDIFEEVFLRTVRINTLDNDEYTLLQQAMIDILDEGEYVRVLGKGENRTDMKVALMPIADPEHQTRFENCAADVNIPVGEVFTSPVLEGTEGVLHVSSVYLEGVEFKDLYLEFKDGYVTGYGCGNFEDEKEGRRLIEEQILFNHKTLPIGEFAIGTNTTAYMTAKKLDIFDRLPILIAEKTGPHFAVGDTCYSRSEDTAVFNPNGKEIISRDNTCSAKRKSEPDKAYFNCHTDITIPYDELLSISVVHSDGSECFIIKDGRFVVPGARVLNAAFDE